MCWLGMLAPVAAGMPTNTLFEQIAAAKELQRQGVSEVLVTLGEGGSMLIKSDGGIVRQDCFRVDKVVDTTGAGDCFRAAFTVGISENM